MTDENEGDAILSTASLINSNDKDQTTSGVRTNSIIIVDPDTSVCSVVQSINNDDNNNNNDDTPPFSSIFLTGISINIFGLKWSIILAEAGYVSYVAANIYPLPSLMYISAALVGLAAGPLWTAKATYLNRIANYHAQHKHQRVEVSVSLFFGIFFGFLGTSTIWGNIISYFVLNQSNYPQKVNCGIYFDPRSSISTNITGDINEITVRYVLFYKKINQTHVRYCTLKRYILCGTFTGMGILSMVLPFLILDQVELSKRRK
ncbi:unnamed protein product [Rotaria sordida]|uniref:Uncharacterized protein n=1 Tax=Rotaria sordida TaxID=392033 RepID=A0A815YEH4_9BILA|nr:unnamed protein product [Rotaria sordida]CAF1569774.1 unnamed protein product [Rotaria sordida]